MNQKPMLIPWKWLNADKFVTSDFNEGFMERSVLWNWLPSGITLCDEKQIGDG